MARKDHVLTKIGMSMLAEFAVTTRNCRVDCHALTLAGYACHLMSQCERMIQFCIANTAFAEPMQIRAAHTDRFHTDQFLPCSCHWDVFFV